MDDPNGPTPCDEIVNEENRKKKGFAYIIAVVVNFEK